MQPKSLGRERRATWFLAFLLGLLALPRESHAYLDPASGSILLQVILGGVAGAGLLVKLYWHRLLRLVGLRGASEESREG